MAKIIEFYIPANFHKTEKVTRQERGRVIVFPLPAKKSA